jgi:hypothetical protein
MWMIPRLALGGYNDDQLIGEFGLPIHKEETLMSYRLNATFFAMLATLSFASAAQAGRTETRTCRANYEVTVMNWAGTEDYVTVDMPAFLGVGRADGLRKYARARSLARNRAVACMDEHFSDPSHDAHMCEPHWIANSSTRNYVINDADLAYELLACSEGWVAEGYPGGHWGYAYTVRAETTGIDPCPSSTWLGARRARCWGPIPTQLCGQEVVLRSNQGDYLSRESDGSIGVDSWGGPDAEWTVECSGSRVVQLRSAEGDYLHRPNSSQGVTTWDTGIGNRWVLIRENGDRIKLRSWKGDYLHRSSGGVTTWDTGAGNLWTIELL